MISKCQDSLLNRLRAFLELAGSNSRGWIVLAVVGSVFLAGLDTFGVAAMVPLMTLFSGVEPSSGVLGLIARLLGTTDPAVLTPVVAGLVALVFILKSACTIPFRWWLVGRTTRVSADAATELLRRYVLSPYVAHRARKLSEVYRNISDSTGQSASVLLGVVGIVSDLLVLVSILVVLFVNAPLVTVFAVVFFGLLLGATQRFLRRRQTKIGEELAEAGLSGWQFMLPALDGFREARLTSSGGALVDGYGRARRRSADAQRSLSLVSELPKYLLEIGFVLAIVAIAGILFATGSRDTALTILGVFAAASLRALPTLNRVSASFATVRSGQVGLRIVTDAADELASVPLHEEEPRSGEEYRGDIEVVNATYVYPDATEPVIRDLSVTIAENTTTAFVGSSGAGKSTLLDLILGLLEPTSGTIRCGGRLTSDDPAAWYAGLGVVPQDVFLLNGTLAANIAFGVPADQIDSDRVAEVLQHAELGELVAALPEGLETIVGERGVRLSGGQRQRLGLARAMYRRPRVLVLDEATSALDNETEHEIAETLRGLRGQMTVIIVAHRLSTVRDADEIVFLSGGSVEGKGRFEEIRERIPAFARLVELGGLN